MAQVFISYSRRDLQFIEQLVSDLKQTGIDVWYDLTGLEGGARWRLEIQKAIQASDYVIVVLSPHSIESEWVEREHLYANNLKKKILPLMYRECELPMSYLDLNYIDVQGENYSLNFDKIKRFLDTVPSADTSTDTPAARRKGPLERISSAKRSTISFFAIFGAVAVLSLVAILLLNNARNNKESPDSNIPPQEAFPSTSTSETVMGQVITTSTSVQPSITSTQAVPMLPPMVTSAPAQPTVAGDAAFIQVATSKAMGGNWTSIDDPLAFEPDVLVFAMPNYDSPDSNVGIRNDHLIAVQRRMPETEEQWAIINQDGGGMPQLAAFNIQILRPGPNAFIHTVTLSNRRDNYTIIDHPLASNPDALVFAIPNWTADGSIMHDIHPIGVRFIENRWVIFNEDRYPMREGTAFNVQILNPETTPNAFVHTSTEANTPKHYNYTIIDESIPSNALVFIMPRISSEGKEVFISHPIGVWNNSPEQQQWAIFYQNAELNMPEGAEFNVLILPADQ